MVEVKKRRLTKNQLAIVITSAVLVFLIAGYAILTAVIASISGKEEQQAQQSQPIELKEGESRYGSSPIAYIRAPRALNTSFATEKAAPFAISSPIFIFSRVFSASDTICAT